MLSIDTIAHVTVTASRSASAPSVFDTGLLLIRDSNYAAAKRLLTFTSAESAASGLIEAGFAATTEAYKAAQKYFSASPAPAKLLVSCYPTSESPAEALAAVLNQTADFYGVCLGQAETDQVILALAAYVEAASAHMALFVPAVGTASSQTAAMALMGALMTAGYSRTMAIFCSAVSDAAAVMGTAMGLQLAHPSTAFSLCYKQIAGMATIDLPENKVEAIEAINGNVYIIRGYTHRLLEKGSMASGSRYDEILYLDMIADRLQNAAVSLLAENPDRMPQTDDASAQFINRFSSILMGFREMGVLAPAAWRGQDAGPIAQGEVLENGFALWADSYDSQSDEDRAAHKAMPIQVALTLAGSLESVVIAVNVQV